ncbi:head-tail connector protein [Sphingomonas jatrophae]|nr:hypothetical protein [Sphingomonas jatrophae]
MSPPAITPAEAKAYARVDGADEDALFARLVDVATALAERFTGQALVAREVTETLRGAAGWQRLGQTPVIAITGVAGADGVTLPVDAYAVDIDAAGDGWVRGAAGLRVTYRAGLAETAEEVPAPLRQGVARLVAHCHAHRDAADEGAPPAAVAALWRPWRRIGFGHEVRR